MKKYSEIQNSRIILRNSIPLNTPLGLFIDPTNMCNFKCRFCPRNSKDFSQYAGQYCHMDRRLFEKIIDDLQEFPENIKNVRLYYLGEPFLCPDFLLMLKMLSDGHGTNAYRYFLYRLGAVVFHRFIRGIYYEYQYSCYASSPCCRREEDQF